ncbi:uncharacterized protein TNCV_2848201 [Trichonephila clavipes]|nr:uncharacterized protein TNCV_2848201 [Trichonephila clavipes]
MDEILTTARDLELEVNEDDIEELIMGHEDELTIEEPQEILNEEHQETQRNVSPSEQEEDERGPMPTSVIKDLLKKWADVRARVLEWHPNQAAVNEIADGLAREGSHKGSTRGGCITFLKIATRVIQDISSSWRWAPVHEWYEEKRPDAALLGTDSRRDETIFARLRSGHTRVQRQVAGLQSLPFLAELQ